MKSIKDISGLISIRGHHFYANLVNSNSVVLDLGAHLGQFSHEVSQQFGCQCYAVEALPSLHKKIQETHLIRKFNYAISHSNEPVKFCVTDNPEYNHIGNWAVSAVQEKITVEGISLESFLKKHHIQSVDLLKVDIEGAEIDLFNSISDETLCKIKQLTVEFHDFAFPIQKEVEAIKERLKSLDFVCVVFSKYNNGDVLFINKKQCQIPLLNFIYIKYFSKYVRGFIRMFMRLFK
ncbi:MULTISPECIES: FkbM family methyltransferase [Nostocales]|uniref:FkbM family methyltransferase n=3 Tax=Nostocales TaxID=1161 RepID=A0A8S9SVX7_9CYAN|nr:FkbM family methyltransferase [Tolypothrix bouteillei]KAF3884591.1 FkbM family methyltransferase [Tolypothrix bouteillei VB521301]